MRPAASQRNSRKTPERSKMADGSHGESDSCPKKMNNFPFSLCSEDTSNSDRVKLSFYTELNASESCEESESRAALPDVTAASASSSARPLNSSEGHTEQVEDRKKRCFDRYDSSESSDSGVVVLSPSESSACSGSDITEPRSPRSPASASPSPAPSDEDSGAADARMPPWACEPAPRRPHPHTLPADPSHHRLHRRITEYFNHKMKPHNGLKRDATQPANEDCKRRCLPKNGHSRELEKYISYLSQTLSPRVLLDVGKQDKTSNHIDAKSNDLNKGFSSSNNGFNSSSNGFNTYNNGFIASNTTFNSPSKGLNSPHMNGLIDYSRKEKVHTVVNGFTGHKQTPESSTKERSTNLNGFVEGKSQGFQDKKMTVDSSANGIVKKRYEEPMVKCKTLITSPNDNLVGLRVAKPDSTKLNDVVSSTTKLDSKMNGVTCGSNNISLNPLTPKLAPAKREAQRKIAQPAKRTNRKSSACIANSKNLTWSKANNLKQVQLQKQNCANAVQNMSNDATAAPKINIPNGVRQVPVTMNGSLNNLNVSVPNLQNCHQINFQQQCNGTVSSSNLASFVVPQNVMLTALRIPQNGIPAQSVNHQHNNMNNLGAFRQNVSSPNKLNGQFVFPIVQNLNGAVVQIPNLMAKVPTNFVLPQQAQLSTRQDHLQHQQAAQFLINGTILKLAHNMNSAYTNVNKTVPTSSQSIPINKNAPGMPPVGTVVQKSNYTVNLSHPMLVSQPGFIVTSVPNINVKETWSYTSTNTASSTQNSSCPSPIVHHPATSVLATFPGQTLHTSRIPLAPVKPPDNPIQGTDPPSSTVKEPDSEQAAPKCDIPWLTKTVNNNHVSLDTIQKRAFAQVCNLSEKLLDFKKEEEDQKPFKVEMETLRMDKTSEEIRRVEEVARREETLFTQITVLKDVSSSVQNTLIDSSYPSVPTPESPVSPDVGIETDKSMDSSSDSQSSASKEGYDSALSLSISVSTAEAQSQKSPILKQPKTLRFPLKSLVKCDTGKRKSSTHTSSVTVCMWENCKRKFDEETCLLEHLQMEHVDTQAGCENYVCQWEQCKVKGKPSCSRLWLERHALSHGGNKPFKCIVDGCGKRFSTQILLERHVNNHFREQSPNSSSSKKATDSTPKLIRRNGKKLRYRRQPWSARMFDFFDAGTMEGLAYRLQRCTRWRLGGGSPYRESNGHHTVTLQAVASAARYNAALGVRETLVTYSPADVLEDEWVPEKEFKRSRRVPISSLPASSKVALYEQFSASYTRAPSPPPPPPQPPAKPRACTSSRMLSNLLASTGSKAEPAAEPAPAPAAPSDDKQEVTGAKRRKQGRRHGGNAFWPCGR